MIKNVVREYHFSPATVGDFYFDEVDFFGLEYWDNDVNDIVTELKKR